METQMADETAFDLDPNDILESGNPTEPEVEPVEPVEGEEPVEPTEPSEPVEGEEPAEGEEPVEGEDGKGAGKGDDDIDLRKAAKELRESLNKFRETDPKGAKLLRQALGHDLAYQESFKTPEDARVFKAKYDAVGGDEGFTQIQEHATRYQEQEAASEAGDPAIIDNYAQDFPDGFKKSVPYGLDKLKSIDIGTYNKVIGPHLVDALETAGIGNVLETLRQAEEAGGTLTMKDGSTITSKGLINSLVSWMGGQTSAAKALRTSAANPAMDEVTKREQAVSAQENKMFESQWRTPVGDHASAAIYKAGSGYVKNVSIANQRDFFKAVIGELNTRVTGDKTYMSQEKALLSSKNRDINKIITFKKVKIDTVIQGAVEKVAKDYGYKLGATTAPKPGVKPGAKGAAPVVVGVGSSPKNPVYVAAKPPLADHDKEKMGADYVDYAILGKALMKSGPYKGKWVTWRGKPAK